jgi:hypothetical protein
MILHGLVSDAIYGERGSPFVFLQAGIAVALGGFLPSLAQPTTGRPRWKVVSAGAAFLILIALLYGFRNSLLSSWYANLGAVEMARIELENFPTGKWEDGRIVPSLAGAEELFERSLWFNPANPTANHRLSLIASLRYDFAHAASHCELAYRQDSDHRGYLKELGYQFAWMGEFDRAEKLLSLIPEAEGEMKTYQWWWVIQGRSDLAGNAEIVVKRLENKGR